MSVIGSDLFLLVSNKGDLPPVLHGQLLLLILIFAKLDLSSLPLHSLSLILVYFLQITCQRLMLYYLLTCLQELS